MTDNAQQQDFGTIVQKRSPLRCHLLSRIPIFNRYGEARMYELKFTAGNMLALDRLEEKHVYHVLFGFLIRRPIESFVGAGNIGAIRMPVTETLYQNLHLYNPDRLCIIIPYNQEPTENNMAYIRLLKRAGVHFAIDHTRLFAGDFKEVSSCFDFILADAKDHFVEKVVLFNQMVEKSNNLINLVAHNIKTQAEADTVFKQGASHVLFKFYRSPLASQEQEFTGQNIKQDIVVLLSEVFKDEPDFQKLAKIISRHNFMLVAMLNIIRTMLPNSEEIKSLDQAVAYLGTEQLRTFICLSCAEAITAQWCVKSGNFGKANHTSSWELLRYSLVRSKFISDLCEKFGDMGAKRHAFQVGLFSVIDSVIDDDGDEPDDLKKGLQGLIQGNMSRYNILGTLVGCIGAIESQDLQSIIKAVNTARIPINAVLKTFEDSIMWSNKIFALLRSKKLIRR